MKALQYQSRLREELTQNYNICSMMSTRNPLTYEQMLYAIHNQRISMQKILYFRNKKYQKEEAPLRRTFLVSDALELSEAIIAKGWRFSKSLSQANKNSPRNTNRLDSSKQLEKDYETLRTNDDHPQRANPQKMMQAREKQKEQIRMRVLMIEEQMAVLQANMNATRSEEEAASYQQEYMKLRKQLLEIRNRRRLKKEQAEIERVREEVTEVPEWLLELIREMNEAKNESRKMLNKDGGFEEKISKAEQIIRLKQIFQFFAKSQIMNMKFFSDVQKDHDSIPVEIFSKFVKDWGLARIVPPEEINKIFRHRSRGNRQIGFAGFCDVLRDIHNFQCIREEKEFNAETLSKYLQDYIVSKQKMSKVTNNHNKKPSNGYKFKPHSHSGKYLADVESDLQERKIKLNFLAGPQNSLSMKKKKEESRRHHLSTDSTREKSVFNRSSLVDTNTIGSQSNSYAMRFKDSKKGRFRTEAPHLQRTEVLIARTNLKTEQQENEEEMASHERNPNRIMQQFEDLIEMSEEDEYLNKHLMLPPIEAKKKRQRNFRLNY